MKYCTKCGKELVDEAVICPVCGCACDPGFYCSRKEEERVSIGLCVLAFFIPIFGIVYWAVQRHETPKNANAIGLTALISWVINIVSSIIASAFLPEFLATVINNIQF